VFYLLTDYSFPTQSENDVLVRAHSCVTALTQITTNPTGTASVSEANSDIIARSQAVVGELAIAIQATDDPVLLEEQLEVNDQLLGLLKKVPTGAKPQLTLQGLGLHLNGSSTSSLNSQQEPSNTTNGHLNGERVPSSEETSLLGSDEGDEEEVTTPRVDKGKRKADPVPIEHEKILSPTVMSPTFLITEDEDEEGERIDYFPSEGVDVNPSPTDRSRNWVAEEGEVFRKGQVLLGPEEMEGEYAGEDLRREVLASRFPCTHGLTIPSL
jgi:protein phosphatase 1 regulatory subunit 37